jgi:mRNA interferase RelE/StbE
LAWAIEFEAQADKQLDRLNPRDAARIVAALEEISQLEDPRQRGHVLAGKLSGLWRYRVGDWRVICRFENERMVILGSVDNQDSQVGIFLIQAIHWYGGQHGWQDESYGTISGIGSKTFCLARRVMRGGQHRIIANSLTPYSGLRAQAAIGANCRPSLANGTVFFRDITAGHSRVSGRVFSKPWRTTRTLNTS